MKSTTPTPNTLDEILEEKIDAAIERKLRGVSVEYSTNNLPPDVRSRAGFNRLAPMVEGARKSGRVWIVSVTEWRAFRSTKPARHHAVEVPAAPVSAPRTIDDDVLDELGLTGSSK